MALAPAPVSSHTSASLVLVSYKMSLEGAKAPVVESEIVRSSASAGSFPNDRSPTPQSAIPPPAAHACANRRTGAGDLAVPAVGVQRVAGFPLPGLDRQ